MPDQPPNPHARFQELTEALFRETNAFVAGCTDSLKARSAFSEKLIVLNGATLALSFSAASTFHERGAIAIAGSSFLFSAWRLLIASIILALMGQWVGVTSSANALASGSGALLRERLGMWENELRKLTQSDAPSGTLEADMARRIMKARRAVTIGERLTNWLAVAAQILTISSFIFLYKFAHASLLSR